MRKNKQIISLALAGTIVSGMTPAIMAHASIGQDNVYEDDRVSDKSITAPISEAKEVSEATKKLHALGIVAGKGDGDFHEQDHMTRAEFTKTILYALGLENSGNAFMKDMNVFTDVSSDAWYAGTVNMAYSVGLVSGVGENRFAPEKEISHAEAITLVVNALGYKEATNSKLPWPVGSIVKASELGILDGIELENSKAPATRGEVFAYVAKALDVKVLEHNGNVFQVSDKTLLEKKLDMTSTTVEVIEVGGLLDSSLNSNQIVVRGIFDKKEKEKETKTFTLKAEVENPLDLLFTEVQIIANKNGEINFLKSVKERKLKSDTVERITADKIYMKDLKDYYTLSKDVEMIIDYTASTKSNLDKIKVNAKVMYEVKNKEIIKIIATNYNTPLIVETLKNDTIIFRNSSNVKLKDYDEVVVYLNGKQAKASDLKEYDVVYRFKDKDKVILEAYRNVVSGKVTRIDSGATPKYIYVDSVKMDINNTDALFSIDKGDKLSNRFDQNFLGSDVSVYHDAFGKVIMIIGDTQGSQGNFFVVDSVIKDVLENKEISNWVKLVDQNGRTKNFRLSDSVKVNDLRADSFVAVVFNGEVITSIEDVTSSKAQLGRFEDVTLQNVDFSDGKTIDTDGLRIRHENKYFFIENRDVPVFFIDKDNEISVGTIKDLSGATGKADLVLITDHMDVHYIFVRNTGDNIDISREKTTAVLMDSYRASKDGDKGLYFELSNGMNYFVKDSVDVTTAFTERGYGDATHSLIDIADGDIIAYTLDEKDRIKRVEEIDLTSKFDLHLNTVKEVRSNSININGTWYAVAKNVSIADVRDTKNIEYLEDVRDIPKYTRVAFSLNNYGEVNALSVISNERDTTYVSTLVNENKALDAVYQLETNLTKVEKLEKVTMKEVTALKAEIATTKTLMEKVETNRVKEEMKAKISAVETKVLAMEDVLVQAELKTATTAKVVELEKSVSLLTAESTLEEIATIEAVIVEVEKDILTIKDETVKTDLTNRVNVAKETVTTLKTEIDTPEEGEVEETPEV